MSWASITVAWCHHCDFMGIYCRRRNYSPMGRWILGGRWDLSWILISIGIGRNCGRRWRSHWRPDFGCDSAKIRPWLRPKFDRIAIASGCAIGGCESWGFRPWSSWTPMLAGPWLSFGRITAGIWRSVGDATEWVRGVGQCSMRVSFLRRPA